MKSRTLPPHLQSEKQFQQFLTAQAAQQKKNAEREARGEEPRPLSKGKELEKQAEQKLASDYTKVQEVGGLIGRFVLALLAVIA